MLLVRRKIHIPITLNDASAGLSVEAEVTEVGTVSAFSSSSTLTKSTSCPSVEGSSNWPDSFDGL